MLLCVTVGLLLLLVTMSSKDNTSSTMAASAFEIQPNGDSSTTVEEGTKKVKFTTDTDSSSSGSSSSSTTKSKKTEWPELVGLDGEEAKRKVMEERSDLSTIQIVPNNSMVTMDYREDRVRIFVDPKTNKVTKPPRIG